MKTTKHLQAAKTFDSPDDASDYALAYNEERNPHIWGRIAQVMADRSEWPNQIFAVGIFATDTNVQVGFIAKD